MRRWRSACIFAICSPDAASLFFGSSSSVRPKAAQAPSQLLPLPGRMPGIHRIEGASAAGNAPVAPLPYRAQTAANYMGGGEATRSAMIKLGPCTGAAVSAHVGHTQAATRSVRHDCPER